MSFKELLAKAESGDTDAMMAVAKAYADGDGVEQDFEKSGDWALRAADHGTAEAKEAMKTVYGSTVTPKAGLKALLILVAIGTAIGIGVGLFLGITYGFADEVVAYVVIFGLAGFSAVAILRVLRDMLILWWRITTQKPVGEFEYIDGLPFLGTMVSAVEAICGAFPTILVRFVVGFIAAYILGAILLFTTPILTIIRIIRLKKRTGY